MEKFAISTDSTSDFLATEIEELGLYVGKLNYTINENNKLTEYLDDFKDLNEYTDFYNKLRKGAVSKTSILNVQAHIDLFTKMAEDGIKNALHISQAMGLSPTLVNAEEAIKEVKKKYPDINYVAIESSTTTVAEGNLVRVALKLREQGKSMNETIDILNDLKMKTQHFILVNDLMYLKRGGRISGVKATLGTILNLKPIIEFTKEGKLEIIRKESGIKKAVRSIIDDVKKNFTFHKEFGTPIVAHCDNLEGAENIAKQIEEILGVKPEIRIVGPIIGTHLGPDAIGFTFISNEPRRY
ncbi:MAG: DegV family protein [Christensenellales bacterium]